jgi:release factor glutamine methyltransferase
VPADDSRRDASLLARWLLGWDDAHWLTRRHEPVPPDFSTPFESVVARRKRREPLAYITGEREFYGRSFRVSSDVLIPRPETELIVDEALRRLRAGEADTIVDVGTGSGCLAITLAVERPTLRVVAVDSSDAALEVARHNARRQGVMDRLDFRHGHLLDGIAPAGMIVSNPPYVRDVDRPSIAPEVRDYEPAGALFAGHDGLDIIRELVPAAVGALVPGGFLIFEFGWEQADAVESIVESTSELALAEVRHDLQGIPRVAIAQRTTASVR